MPDVGYGGGADVGAGGGNAGGGGNYGGGNIDANNNGLVDVTSSTGATVSSGSGGTIDSGMSINGPGSSPDYTESIVGIPLLDPIAQMTYDQEAIDIAQARADDNNSGLLGSIAGFLGFTDRASTAFPGKIETAFSFNPATFALGLVNPLLGPAVKATGVLDGLNVEVGSTITGSFYDADPAAPTLGGGLTGGSGNDGFASVFSGPSGAFTDFSGPQGLEAGQGVSYEALALPIYGGIPIEAGSSITDPIEGYPVAATDPSAAPVAAADNQSILPELAMLAALAIEISG